MPEPAWRGRAASAGQLCPFPHRWAGSRWGVIVHGWVANAAKVPSPNTSVHTPELTQKGSHLHQWKVWQRLVPPLQGGNKDQITTQIHSLVPALLLGQGIYTLSLSQNGLYGCWPVLEHCFMYHTCWAIHTTSAVHHNGMVTTTYQIQ